MKSLNHLSLLCVLLLPFSQFANADPIAGSLNPDLKTTSNPVSTLQGSPTRSPQAFRFDNTSGSALFPLSSGTTEVNHLLSVTLETKPPIVAGTTARPRTASGNGTELAAEAGFEDPATHSAVPGPGTGAAAFHLGASPAATAVNLEPSSLILLGTGLICAAAVVLRRRRTI